MDQYPNSDEEFELMYGAELEVMRETEEFDEIDHNVGPKSRKSLDFTTPTNKNVQIVSQNNVAKSQVEPGTSNQLDNSFDRDFSVIQPDTPQNVKKRTIQQLFGDIDDILLDGITNQCKKTKLEDASLIDLILERRKLEKEKQNPNLSIQGQVYNLDEHIKHNLSYRVPNYPFITITRHDGERIYIRMHSEEYMKAELEAFTKNNSSTGFAGNHFEEVWKNAREILNKQLNRQNTQTAPMPSNKPKLDTQLWVDLYKPRKYMDLLSDETTNRTLLKWVKLWDKVVFKRKPSMKTIIRQEIELKNNVFQEVDFQLDEHDRPKHKVALLCGPPGYGKTTLAHIVAKHAGYNVVEVNASDDRNVDAFRKTLETATQMRSVVDQENRPNCIVFDEIDGAPSASIEFLIKFINGTAGKDKKGKKKRPQILKRPIICICNDVYVPALRPLRQIAFVLNFPPINSARLGERLLYIAKRQNIKTDLLTMIVLSEKSNLDIRACLSTLHLYKAQKKEILYTDIADMNIGLKDMQKGLFSVWDEIFTIGRKRFNVGSGFKELSMNMRMQNTLNSVQSFGDYERLAQGVFENYIEVKQRDQTLNPTVEALNWFCMFDNINRKIMETQEFSLMAYMPYPFVIWHFIFAQLGRRNLTYPSKSYEASVKQKNRDAIVSEVMRGMSTNIRTFLTNTILKLDTLPLLNSIMVPSDKSTKLTVLGKLEKTDLERIVGVMIDFNLTYVQERTAEGSYVFTLDPDVLDATVFPSVDVQRRTLTYSTKHLISREIELERMRRAEAVQVQHRLQEDAKPNKKPEVETVKKPQPPPEAAKVTIATPEVDDAGEKPKKTPTPHQLLKVQLKRKNILGSKSRDFFSRPNPDEQSAPKADGAGKPAGIWYRFKDGYSNAVRRNIQMKRIL